MVKIKNYRKSFYIKPEYVEFVEEYITYLEKQGLKLSGVIIDLILADLNNKRIQGTKKELKEKRGEKYEIKID